MVTVRHAIELIHSHSYGVLPLQKVVAAKGTVVVEVDMAVVVAKTIRRDTATTAEDTKINFLFLPVTFNADK